MAIELIPKAYTYWRIYRSDIYAATALAAVVSIIDLIIRWDLFCEKARYLILNIGVVKFFIAYSVVFILLTLTIFGLRSCFRWGRHLTSLCIFVLIATNFMYLNVMDNYWSHKDLYIALSNSDLISSAIVSFVSFELIGIIILLALGMYMSSVVINALVTGKSKILNFTPVKSILTFVFLVSVHYFFWGAMYVKLQNIPIDPVSHSLRAMAFLTIENKEFHGIPRERLGPVSLNQTLESVIPRKKLGSIPGGRGGRKDHIVYVIDESVRYDYLGINNSLHDTTPFLSNLDSSNFYNLGLGVSAATCSFQTRSLLLTGVNQVPDVTRQLLRAPTIFQYAREFNYHSVLINAANDSNFPNIVIRDQDMDYIDESYMAKDIPVVEEFIDLSSIPLIHDILNREEPQFVVVVKKGAHFHYEDQYPKNQKEFEHFSPHLSGTDSYDAKRDEMINSYKNVLRFTVDHFLMKLNANMPDGVNVIYTSDHGQSLQENGQTYTHCKDEIEQSLVPVLMFSDHPWMRDIKSKYGKTGDPIISHHQLFPSIVALMSGNRDYKHNQYYSLFSHDKSQAPLKYSTGGLWSFSNVVSLAPAQLNHFINLE